MFDVIQKLFGKVNWDGTDRRKVVRSRCNLELWLVKQKTMVRVRDLGQSGLRLDCPAVYAPQLKRGTQIELAPGDEQAPPVRARVCWIKSSAEVSRLGLRFTSIIKDTWMQNLIDRVAGQPKQKRRHIRVRTDWTVQAYASGIPLEARLRDLSVTGCRFETIDSVVVGQALRLKMGSIEVAAEVRRVSGQGAVNLVGVRFDVAEPETGQLVSLLRKLTGG